MAKTLSPIDAFLAPLAKLAAKYPDLEGEVIWADADGWQGQDDTEGLLDAEEVPYYAEGMLIEGFRMQWQVLAEIEQPKDPVQIRLFFWQGDNAPPPSEAGLVLLASGTWNG